MFGVQQHLQVVVCKNADEAVERGFDYKGTDIKACEIQTAVVVKNGMASGVSTVDLIIVDEQGNKKVVMITGNLIRTLVAAL